jgi:N-acetylmuramoyl-L-alanine amidase
MTALVVLAALAGGGCGSEPATRAPIPASTSVAAVPTSNGSIEIGRSAQGRPIRAERIGGARASIALLVAGPVHGNEPAGKQVIARLRRQRPPSGTAIWLIPDPNPDGAAAGTRQNADGVDLNRNFPYRWRADGHPFDTYHSGSGPLSEPESQALARFVERVKPRATLWYHQALSMVVRSAGDPVLQRLYARRSGLPVRSLPAYHGTISSWQSVRHPADTPFVVELPGGRLSAAGARRHVGAVLALARMLAPRPVVAKPIPYGSERQAQMRAYALRHYGIDSARLRAPKVIVEHTTATATFAPVFDTFAANQPDVELHELPGVCSHYVVDRDGTVYSLVPTTLACRHAVGLNDTAIGIEHVGLSDAQVLGNRRQLQASLRLTRTLQGRYGIRTRNVIGHAESLTSPYHHERVARLRSQTHADLPKLAMDRYRRLLEALPAPASLRPGAAGAR